MTSTIEAESLIDLQYRQQILRDELMKQQILEQQFQQQQAIIAQQEMNQMPDRGSFGPIIDQDSLLIQSQQLFQKIQQQQLALRQSQLIRRQRLTEGMDKNQIKDQFMALAGRQSHV